ncbi:MAG: metalloregulator ArsR/SmtB family transcription factor [Acidobacteriota bacterium]|nr:metalloregulator ArsR/SmtB family transcription factor [Acidobacteriota bacterium]
MTGGPAQLETLQEVSQELMEKIARRLKAMGHPTRLRILHALEEGELSVSDILTRVGGRQANLSKHLTVLRGAKLVTSRRDGVSVCYRICDPIVFRICESVCDSLEREASDEVDKIRQARSLMLAGKP